jgi:hypothetical protein
MVFNNQADYVKHDNLNESQSNTSSRSLFTDGSFALNAPLLDMLTLPVIELSACYARVAMGIYLPPSDGAPAAALTIHTQQGDTTGAYYKELLGIAVAALVSTVTPIATFADCSSAIRRATQAASSLGPVIGHLQHGTILQQGHGSGRWVLDPFMALYGDVPNLTTSTSTEKPETYTISMPIHHRDGRDIVLP